MDEIPAMARILRWRGLCLGQAMTGYDPSQKIGHGMPIPLSGCRRPRAKPAGTRRRPESGGFFHHLWDTINPFQHLPGVSTVYRAVTGEHIGTFEKIAGDTLYGGLWGAVASMADTAFEAATGKDFGDTVLALFTGSHQDAAPNGRRHAGGPAGGRHAGPPMPPRRCRQRHAEQGREQRAGPAGDVRLSPIDGPACCGARQLTL